MSLTVGWVGTWHPRHGSPRWFERGSMWQGWAGRQRVSSYVKKKDGSWIRIDISSQQWLCGNIANWQAQSENAKILLEEFWLVWKMKTKVSKCVKMKSIGSIYYSEFLWEQQK